MREGFLGGGVMNLKEIPLGEGTCDFFLLKR